MSAGAHESITLAVGDSVTPKFSIKTDTVLAAIGNSTLVARACGQSFIFLRNYRRGVPISADTVDVTVTCGPVILPPVSTLDTVLTVCARPNPDSLAKYKPSGDSTVDPNRIPCLIPEGSDITRDKPAFPPQPFVMYSRTRPKPSVPIA